MYLPFVNQCLRKKKQDTCKAHESASPNKARLIRCYGTYESYLERKEDNLRHANVLRRKDAAQERLVNVFL